MSCSAILWWDARCVGTWTQQQVVGASITCSSFWSDLFLEVIDSFRIRKPSFTPPVTVCWIFPGEHQVAADFPVLVRCDVFASPAGTWEMCGKAHWDPLQVPFWDRWCDRIHTNTNKNDLGAWGGPVAVATVQRAACEEVEPQLLLWSELLAEQHLLVDRCRVVTVIEQLPLLAQNCWAGLHEGPRGHVRARIEQTITNN